MTSAISIMVALLEWATGARADGRSAKADPVRVQICYEVEHRVLLDGFELSMAQDKASQLLAEAGIRLEWRAGRSLEHKEGVRVVPLKFLLVAPERISKKRTVMAETTLARTGGVIAMFDDRITLYLSFCQRAVRWKVLGHILAHEIVHALEGVARHSEAGLMKASWTAQDLRSITGAGLGLATEDRELLRTSIPVNSHGDGIGAKVTHDLYIQRLDAVGRPVQIKPNAEGDNECQLQSMFHNHLKCFGENDLDGILADYSSDVVLFTPDGPLKGIDAIKPFFEAFFSEFANPGASFSIRQRYFEGDYAYLLWTAETADNSYDSATDTFVVQNGKIVAQTFAAKITPNH